MVDMNKEDVLTTVPVRLVTPLWDAKDERIVRWKLVVSEKPLEAGATFREYEVSPSQMRMPAESLVLMADDTVVGYGWKPIVVTSHFYHPIPHQRILRWFEETLRAGIDKMPMQMRPYIDEPTRVVMLFDMGEKVDIMGDKLSFHLTVTNSYDLSLGIHTDGYLRNEEKGWGFFLGLAGKWQGTFKHYWERDDLKDKMRERILAIREKKSERIKQIAGFAATLVTPDTFTKVGRALNCQKREKMNWDMVVPNLLPEDVKITTTWVKNAGFTVTTFNGPITAWQMLSLFASWSQSLDADRRADVAQRLYSVVDKILTDEAKAPLAPA